MTPTEAMICLQKPKLDDQTLSPSNSASKTSTGAPLFYHQARSLISEEPSSKILYKSPKLRHRRQAQTPRKL
ncbi:hypothetical protein M758_1G064600 [Ceratodon purpureus]|uniref:Uncharacterized protein n=1 Tax=Ceratodon purpureus TaxID=3225 RepID=A0A8T0J4A0_CERPU|nr:hypothetical protein KC19_1G066600 [Ceratodon purpureus]KAG0628941.1 hypothetical protein M758_1G064600 [Ceratodon purpureus]